jgi:hypothetical protein
MPTELTKQELAVCRATGIRPEDYAQTSTNKDLAERTFADLSPVEQQRII